MRIILKLSFILQGKIYTLTGSKARMRCIGRTGVEGGRDQVFWTSNFYFFSMKENWISSITRYNAEQNINVLFTRILPFVSDVRQWSHPLMIMNLIRYNSHPWIMFSLNWLVIIWRWEVLLNLDVQSLGDGRILDVNGQEGGGSWKLECFNGCQMCIISKLIC